MAGTTDDRQLLLRHTIHQTEIIGADEVLARHNALDGRYQELGAKLDMKMLERSFEERRGKHQDESLTDIGHLVDIIGESNPAHVEVHLREVGRIVSGMPELFHSFGITHIPMYVRNTLEQNLGNGCCPASSADDTYLTCHAVHCAMVS